MCARAQIFRRDQHKVQDLAGLQAIERYNKWQVDPLSLGDSCRGISARCDLNSPATNGTLNGFSAFGAIDCKVCDAKAFQSRRAHSLLCQVTDQMLIKKMVSKAVSGPTYLSQPIFHWSEMFQHIPTLELPRVYHFDFVDMEN